MKADVISKLCKTVYKRFPEVAGTKPKVTLQSAGKYLLLFSSKGIASMGKEISHTVRVVSDEQGIIMKISSSRG
ncbi:MAG: hypothetical protein ABIG43_02595 [Chloroflexota bacterium]